MSTTIHNFEKTKKNRINFDPDIWGHYAWPFLFSTAFGYPKNPTKDEINEARDCYTSIMKFLIACSKCRGHAATNLNKYPLTDNVLSTRTNLIIWLTNIKNEINKMQGKKTYSVDETVNYYYNILKDNKSKNKELPTKSSNYNIIISMLIIGLIITFLFLYMRK